MFVVSCFFSYYWLVLLLVIRCGWNLVVCIVVMCCLVFLWLWYWFSVMVLVFLFWLMM